jgi:hypothetical protein
MPSSPRNPEARSPSLPLVIPDDVDVAILGCQVQGTGAIGVGSVPWPGLQQGRAHVAAQQQLDHLKGGVRVGRTWLGATPDHTQGKEDRQESCLAPQGDLPRRGRTHRPVLGITSVIHPPRHPHKTSPRRSDHAELRGAEECDPHQMERSLPSRPSAPASWAPSGPARLHSARVAFLGAGGDCWS